MKTSSATRFGMDSALSVELISKVGRILADMDRVSHNTLFGCALMTLLLLLGVGFLVGASDVGPKELVHTLTATSGSVADWQASSVLIWWCLYLTVTGGLFCYGAYGFINTLFTHMIRRRAQAILSVRKIEAADPATIVQTLNDQINDLYERVQLVQATQYWILGVLFSAIVLGGPTLGIYAATPLPVLWYLTGLCAIFAAFGVFWNRSRARQTPLSLSDF